MWSGKFAVCHWKLAKVCEDLIWSCENRLSEILCFVFSLSRWVTSDIMFQTSIFRGHLSSVWWLSEAKLRRNIGDVSANFTWFTFVQYCSRIYFWNVQIWSIYPTNLPWWSYYVLSPVHWELSSDYLEASKIKQYCLCGSLSSLASVARKPHSNDSFQLIFKLDPAIISKIMENCGIFYLRNANAW